MCASFRLAQSAAGSFPSRVSPPFYYTYEQFCSKINFYVVGQYTIEVGQNLSSHLEAVLRRLAMVYGRMKWRSILTTFCYRRVKAKAKEASNVREVIQ
jgi:hypothetical protein